MIPTKAEILAFYNCLPSTRDKALFLLLASTGLRINEVTGLLKSDIEFQNRRVVPRGAHSTESTKRSFYSFYNAEAEKMLNEYLASRKDSNPYLFAGFTGNDFNDKETGHLNASTIEAIFRRASEKSEAKIMPQSLREWFAEEISERGLAERYIDFLCGRTPKSVLARHYSDFRPEKMKPRYEKAGLCVLV